MFTALALFLIAFSAVSAANDPCDNPGQLKADLQHCDRFFQCTENGWISLQCRPKTLFNPKILVCDWAKNVKCAKKVYHGVKFNLEPCDNVGDLKPDPKNCDRFFQCSNDGWVNLQCQPPTLFNPKINSCDWEKNVDCKKKTLLGSALEPCDNVGDLKPDPKNCDRFFQCSNDGWVNLQCQPPTLFNPKINSCDWEKNVDCKKKALLGSALEPCDNVGDLKPDPKNCDRFFQCSNDGWVNLQCQPPTLFNPKINSCDWEKNVDCKKKALLGSALEPCDNVGDLKPDPKNCDRFFQCTNGGWANLQCQPPTLFNPAILRCDWARNVDCKN